MPYRSLAVLQKFSRRLQEVEGGGLFDPANEAYQAHPVRFGEEKLGYQFTPQVQTFLRSIRDYRITIAKSATGTGKTHAAACAASWIYKCFEQSQVWTTAAPPIDNLKDLLWGEMHHNIRQHPELFKGDEIQTLRVRRAPRQFIRGVTIPTTGGDRVIESKFSGKHSPVLVFILDEGDAIVDPVYKAIEGCMSGGWARLVVMLNPRSQAGRPYELIQAKKANIVHLDALSHPNVVTGEDVIPGAVTRDETVRRINEWTRPVADGDSNVELWELPDFLVGATAVDDAGKEFSPLLPGTRVIADPAFSYVVLGEYPAQAHDQLISNEWVQAAFARHQQWTNEHGNAAPAGVAPILSLDVATHGVDYNVAAARYGTFVPRLTKWQGLDPPDSAERLLGLYNRLGAWAAVIDEGGVGAGIPKLCSNAGANAHGIFAQNRPTEEPPESTGCGSFHRLRDQLLWKLREWLRTEKAMLPPDERLRRQLTVLTYTRENGVIKVMSTDAIKEILKYSPDELVAVFQTFYEPEQLMPW